MELEQLRHLPSPLTRPFRLRPEKFVRGRPKAAKWVANLKQTIENMLDSLIPGITLKKIPKKAMSISYLTTEPNESRLDPDRLR